MLLKVTSKRQVTFPAAVLESLGASPGDHLEIRETAQGFILRPHRIDRSKLAPLQQKIQKRGEPFDLETFRNQPHEKSLRD
jgi:AbrB family looped-hinge helix DNA binding protein